MTTAGLARMNMILHDFPTANILSGNTLFDPRAILIIKFRKRACTIGKGFARGWRLRHQEAEPNAENATLEELRVAMEAAPNRRSYIRLAVMRSLLMGLERSVVAQQFCRSDRVVRLWIAMFNLGGIDALTTKRPAGRGRRVKLERLRDLLSASVGESAPSWRASLDGSQAPWLSQGATRTRGGLQHHGALPP